METQEHALRNWWIGFVAAAVLVAGCGGSGGGGVAGGGGGGGGPAPTPVFRTALPAGAGVSVLFISGQGRRAEGSLVADLGFIRMQNGTGDIVPTGAAANQLRFPLDGYAISSVDFTLELPGEATTRAYTELPIQLDRMGLETATGSTSWVFNGPPVTLGSFPLDATLMPGRNTSVAIKLNDASLTLTGGAPVFDRALFEGENLDPVDGRINAFLSDFVSFDVSNVPAAQRPVLRSGAAASMVHFSGDNSAISSGFDTDGTFNMLFPNLGAPDEGVIRRPSQAVGQNLPGVWTILEPNPQDPLAATRVSSLQGSWKPFTDVVLDSPDMGMLVFPNSRRSMQRDVVVWQRSGGVITRLYKGHASFTGETGNASFRVWPISNLVDASVTGEVTGNLSIASTSGGLARSGAFTFTATPPGFSAASGRWIMFAR